ncbi:hypothetical protein D3C71_1201840 [compost metagenome]
MCRSIFQAPATDGFYIDAGIGGKFLHGDVLIKFFAIGIFDGPKNTDRLFVTLSQEDTHVFCINADTLIAHNLYLLNC